MTDKEFILAEMKKHLKRKIELRLAAVVGDRVLRALATGTKVDTSPVTPEEVMAVKRIPRA